MCSSSRLLLGVGLSSAVCERRVVRGERERRMEGGKEGGRERWREGRREGWMDGGREGGRE